MDALNIQDLLIKVIEVALLVLSTFLIKYLRGLKDKVVVETDQAIIQNTLSNSIDLVEKVVLHMSQTFVDELKSQGAFTAENQRIAFERARTAVLELLSEESKDIITHLYSDLDSWITIQIEATVKNMKMTKEGE